MPNQFPKTKICRSCFCPFDVYTNRTMNQRKCAKCHAESDKRINSIPERSKCIAKGLALLDENFLYDVAWKKMPRKRGWDDEYWQISITGRDLTDGWLDEPPQGRIVINADRPYKSGDIVGFRVMRTVHMLKHGSRAGETEVREYISLHKAGNSAHSTVIYWSPDDTYNFSPRFSEPEDGELVRSIRAGNETLHIVVEYVGEQEKDSRRHTGIEASEVELLGTRTLLEIGEHHGS